MNKCKLGICFYLVGMMFVLGVSPAFAGPVVTDAEAEKVQEQSQTTSLGGVESAITAYRHGDFAEVLKLLASSGTETYAGSMSEAMRIGASIRLGRHEEGLRGWQELATSARVSSDVCRLVSDAFLAVGDASNAAVVLRRGLLDSPTSVELLHRLGLIRAESGRHESALLYLEAALEQRHASQPSGIELDELARSYLATQQYRKAADLYAGSPGDEGSLRGLATVHMMLAQGQINETLDAVSEINYPAAAEFLFKARLLLLANQPSAALESLTKVPKSLSESSAFTGTSLLALVAAGRIEDAYQLLLRLEQSNVLQDPVPAAIVAAATGDQGLAERYLTKAPLPLPDLAGLPVVQQSISEDSDFEALALAYYRYRLGFFELAREALVGLEGPLPLLLVADSARQLGLVNEALNEYAALIEFVPEAVSLRYQYALVLTEAGSEARADVILKSVLDDRPDYVTAAVSRAELQHATGDLQGAMDTLTFSLNFQPNRAPLLAKLAGYKIDAGEMDSAESILNMLRSAEKANSWSYSHLAGRLALKKGQAAKAKEHLELAVSARMDDKQLLIDLATVYESLGSGRRASSVHELLKVLFI